MKISELLCESDDASLTITPAGDGFTVSSTSKTGPMVQGVYHVWNELRKKKGVRVTMKSGKTIEDTPNAALKILDNRPQGLIFYGVDKDTIQKAVDAAMAKVSREVKAKEKRKADAPQRKKEAQTFYALQRKADMEAYDKEYGKGTWKRVTYKQEGGDDGYQYVVRVDGRSIMNGLTLRQAEYEKRRQVDAIAKREKLGKYAEGK